jgi:hypothetical protein
MRVRPCVKKKDYRIFSFLNKQPRIRDQCAVLPMIRHLIQKNGMKLKRLEKSRKKTHRPNIQKNAPNGQFL